MHASVRAPAVDRVSVALFAVFLLAGAIYVWIAATSVPLALTGAQFDPYNQLANAFLHLRMSVAEAPAGLVNLSEPYNPAQNEVFQPFNGGIHDFALYNGKLFLTWGPAPVIVFLVPMHLLGLEPTASVTTSLFAVVGLGFALASLRVVLRQIGDVPLWMCVLAGFTLALSSAVPFILRRPAVYEEAICAGYCFAMAAVWLALSAIANRAASLTRLALMSLCIGLAIGSRPNLVLLVALLVPVYISLRAIKPRRGLLVALVVPIGVCLVLLMAYDQARFGNPLENGARYQLAGIDQHTAHWDDLSYVPPGLWFYGMSPPRGEILFPFIFLAPPPISYPGSLPGIYAKQLEQTGGLLPMAPIVVFLAALPWIWRRRPRALGPLSIPLLVLAGAGIACMLFLSYVFFSTTERYEVDFATLLLLGALASWFALSKDARGWRRRLVRVGGGMLAVWGCFAGLAISSTGYANLLALNHPGTWNTLKELGAPVSTAIAVFEGHPVLAETSAPELPALYVGERANVTIVSPGTRHIALLAVWTPAVRVENALERAKHSARVLVRGPGHASSIYRIRAGGEAARIPVRVGLGVNHIELIPLATEATETTTATPASQQLLYVEKVSLAGSK